MLGMLRAVTAAAGRWVFRIALATALVAVAPTASAQATMVDSAVYIFDYQNPSWPDPAQWTAHGSGVQEQLVAGEGLFMSDPDNAASRLYSHPTAFLSGDPTSPHATNTAKLRATVRIPVTNNGSAAWTNDHVGFRLIIDDGARRIELVGGRETGTNQRYVRLLNSPAQPISFTWDNDLDNVYELERLADGRAKITVTSAAAIPTQSRTYSLGELPPSGGTPMFAWGTGTTGGGFEVWKDVRAEVHASALTVAIDVRPGNARNRIKPKSRDTLPVAILSADGFDAPIAVDRGSLTFGRTGDEPSLESCTARPVDVNHDGLADLKCHFSIRAAGFQPGDREAVLKGKTTTGTTFTGRDAIATK